jgi:hypothetical protein
VPGVVAPVRVEEPRAELGAGERVPFQCRRAARREDQVVPIARDLGPDLPDPFPGYSEEYRERR